MGSDYTPADDAVLSAGLARAYRRGGAAPTAAELEAEDERARQDMADRDLPPTWIDEDD